MVRAVRGYRIVALDSEGDGDCGNKGMYSRGKMERVGNGSHSGR